MAREMRILDIPDGHPLPRDWLFRLDNEGFEAQIALVEEIGPVFAGCKPLLGDMWLLNEPIGFGDIAHLIFVSVRNRNFLALHGFTSKSRESIDQEIALADKRRRE